jgi:hypothetical protein
MVEHHANRLIDELACFLPAEYDTAQHKVSHLSQAQLELVALVREACLNRTALRARNKTTPLSESSARHRKRQRPIWTCSKQRLSPLETVVLPPTAPAAACAPVRQHQPVLKCPYQKPAEPVKGPELTIKQTAALKQGGVRVKRVVYVVQGTSLEPPSPRDCAPAAYFCEGQHLLSECDHTTLQQSCQWRVQLHLVVQHAGNGTVSHMLLIIQPLQTAAEQQQQQQQQQPVFEHCLSHCEVGALLPASLAVWTDPLLYTTAVKQLQSVWNSAVAALAARVIHTLSSPQRSIQYSTASAAEADAISSSQLPRSTALSNGYVWLDRTLLTTGVRVAWGPLARGRYLPMILTASLHSSSAVVFTAVRATSACPHPVLNGRWQCIADSAALSRCLTPPKHSDNSSYRSSNSSSNSKGGYGSNFVEGRRAVQLGADHYTAENCLAELVARGQLQWACSELMRKAFRLEHTTAGAKLVLVGVTALQHAITPWPQDATQTAVRTAAAVQLQRVQRGRAARHRSRWLKLDVEAARRLAELQLQWAAAAQAKAVRERHVAVAAATAAAVQAVVAAAVRVVTDRVAVAHAQAAAVREQQRTAEAVELAAMPLCDADADNVRPTITTSAAAAAAEGVAEVNTDNTVAGVVAQVERQGSATQPLYSDVCVINGTTVNLVIEDAAVDTVVHNGSGESLLCQPSRRLSVLVQDVATNAQAQLVIESDDLHHMARHHNGGLALVGDVCELIKHSLVLFFSRASDVMLLSYKDKHLKAITQS